MIAVAASVCVCVNKCKCVGREREREGEEKSKHMNDTRPHTATPRLTTFFFSPATPTLPSPPSPYCPSPATPGSRSCCLAVAVELEDVVALPGGAAGAALGLVVEVALAGTAVAAAGGGEAAQLAVLVHGRADPVDARIAADGLVGRVHKDDLKVPV